MKLYLIQHGEAVEKTVDPERPLSAAGRQCVEATAAFAQRAGIRVPVVWHSEKARARQTAEILASRIADGGAHEVHEGLSPNDDVAPLAKNVAQRDQDLAIAGHLPHLSKLASLLLTGKESREVIAFQRGGLVLLERGEDREWRVSGVLPPTILSCQ